MSANAVATPEAVPRCALCGCSLQKPRSIMLGLCNECQSRPEATTLQRDASGRAMPRTRPQAVPRQPRPFTPADKALIRKLHTVLSSAQLLQVLNDRLVADVGGGASLYPLEQLQRELQDVVVAEPGDWTQLRHAIAAARKSGVLAQLTPQLIEDFAVVYSLTPAQLMNLKDVIRHAQGGR